MLVDFVRGFHYLLLGFNGIRDPKLFRFVWIPFLCNLILFSIMLIIAGYGLHHFSEWVQGFFPRWLQWLQWLIWILSLLFSGIILIFLSTFLVNILAAPFNGLLAQMVLHQLNVADQIVPTSAFRSVSTAITRQMQFLAYYLPRAVFYLVLFLIPIIQVVAAPLWFLFNSWVFALQYLDYPMDLHGISITDMKGKMRERKWLCLGFGSGVVLFSLIPLVNFLIVPVAVVGATILWENEYRFK